MTYLYILAVILLALLYMRFEAGFLEVKHIWFTKSVHGLKVLQLSDIHIGRLKVSAGRIREVITQEAPDVILLTGDYVETRDQVPAFMEFLATLGTYPNMYLCLGNHDYRAFRRDDRGLGDFMSQMEAAGITILHNRCVTIEKNAKTYNLIGIADIRYGHHNLEEAFSRCSEKAFASLGFSHNPDIALEIPRGKLDYLFCGHFHGGQIWAPFNLEFKLLRDEKLCKQGIKGGLHKVNGINLYINRGLGNVLFPLRFLSRPEITVYHI